MIVTIPGFRISICRLERVVFLRSKVVVEILGDGLATNPMRSAITYSFERGRTLPHKTATPLRWEGLEYGAGLSSQCTSPARRRLLRKSSDVVRCIDIVLSNLISEVYDDFPVANIGWRWQTALSPP
jgi:hypothetical protein